MLTEKLNNSQRVGYGIADFGINLYFISAMTYLLYFYTDVFGLSAAAAAGVMGVARLVDAITDPMMGGIAERTRSRWGRLRPYLLFGALPLAAIAVLTFTVPDLDASGKLWWAYLTYIGFGIAYTVVSIPYSALTASLTADHEERTVLSTVRMACAFGGGLVVSGVTWDLVGRFESEAEGYQWSMALYAAVATALLWVTFAMTRERIQPPAGQKLKISDSARSVLINPPLLVVIVMFSGGMLSFTVRQAIAPYFFKYNLERPDLVGDLVPDHALHHVPWPVVHADAGAPIRQGGRNSDRRAGDDRCGGGYVFHALFGDRNDFLLGVRDGAGRHADCRAWLGDAAGYRGLRAVAARSACGRGHLLDVELFSEAGQDHRRRRYRHGAGVGGLRGKCRTDAGIARGDSWIDDVGSGRDHGGYGGGRKGLSTGCRGSPEVARRVGCGAVLTRPHPVGGGLRGRRSRDMF